MLKYYSALKKEGNPVICNMTEPEEHYTKQNKPDTGKQIPHDLTSMWSGNN